MRSVRKLAELARHKERGLLSDIDGVIADALEAARDNEHTQTPFVQLGIRSQREESLDEATVRAIDELVKRCRLLPRGDWTVRYAESSSETSA